MKWGGGCCKYPPPKALLLFSKDIAKNLPVLKLVSINGTHIEQWNTLRKQHLVSLKQTIDSSHFSHLLIVQFNSLS